MVGQIITQLQIKATGQYVRSLKRLKKKHYPVELIEDCLRAILNKDHDTLIKIHDHPLVGQWRGYREFHPARIGKASSQLDKWVVVYQIDSDELVLILIEAGNLNVLK